MYLVEHHAFQSLVRYVFDTVVCGLTACPFKQVHELFSSYVNARHRYPAIVVSFLEPSGELIHSCHFVLRAASPVLVTFVMLVTYSRHGERVFHSELAEHTKLPLETDFPAELGNMVHGHHQVGHVS